MGLVVSGGVEERQWEGSEDASASPRRRPTGSLVTPFLGDPVLKGERDAKRER